jgi:hypothetical protein
MTKPAASGRLAGLRSTRASLRATSNDRARPPSGCAASGQAMRLLNQADRFQNVADTLLLGIEKLGEAIGR